MNSRHTLIIAASALLLLGVTALLWFLAISSPPTTIPPGFLPGTLPVSNSGSNMPISQPGGQTIIVGNMRAVRTLDGTIDVLDFTQDSDVASTSDESFLTWSSNSAEYEVFYLPLDQSFSVVLLKEPIGEIRRKVADDMKNKLGVSSKDLCALIAEVTVPYFVNDFYSTKNLGFPGCPGAVKFEGDTNL